MRISFHFLCAKDLRTSLLIMRNRSFLTLLYVGGTYALLQGGGHRPPPYVLSPCRLSEGRGFSNQIVFCWTILSVASGTECMHVTSPVIFRLWWWVLWHAYILYQRLQRGWFRRKQSGWKILVPQIIDTEIVRKVEGPGLLFVLVCMYPLRTGEFKKYDFS